jgi:hypothetical protein
MRSTIEAGLARHAQASLEEGVRAWAGQFNWEDCANRYIERYVAIAKQLSP